MPGGISANVFSAGLGTVWENANGGTLNALVSSGTQDALGDLFSERPSVTLTYNQPLVRGAGLASSTAERLRSARSTLEEQEITFFDATQTLAQTLVSDYCNAFLARGEVDISQQSVDRAKTGYDINSAKFTGAGMKDSDLMPYSPMLSVLSELGCDHPTQEPWVTQVAEIDVFQARLSWQQAQQDLITRQQAYQDAMDQLLLDIGCDPGDTPELITTIPYVPKDYDAGALVPEALVRSTQLAQLDLNREDAVAARRIAESQGRPDVTATLGVTDQGETLGPPVSTGWLAGVGLQFPLLDRQGTENVDHAERALAVLDQRMVATRDQVTQQVQRQVRAAVSARARIDIGEQALLVAQKNRDASQGMYDEGLSDYLHVLDADSRLVQAQSSLLEEQVQYFITSVQVRRALGEDVTQGLPE